MRKTNFSLAALAALPLALALAFSPLFGAPGGTKVARPKAADTAKQEARAAADSSDKEAAADAKAKANAKAAGTDSASKPIVEFKLDTKAIDRSNKEHLTSFADTLAKVTPAVVSIRTAQTVRINPRGLSIEDFLREFHGIPGQQRRNPRSESAAPREEKRPTGLGSGTIIHPDGYILTNRHVVSDSEGDPAEEITVELADKRKFTAKVVGADQKTDIAVIKIDATHLPTAKLADSSGLRVGDIVFAVGNPLGVGMSVSQGIVSALAREVGILRNEQGYESFIQTDASINPGNSGGPLVDADGRVIGVNTAIASPVRASIGIGFAVPSALAVDIISSLVNKGGVSRGYLGVEITDISSELAEYLGLATPKGAFVSHVEEGSPADKAGIKTEDAITAINGETVESSSSLRYLISKLKPGQKAKVEIFRDGKKKTLTVAVGNQRTEETNTALQDVFGAMEFAPLNKETRARYKIPESIEEGVVVTQAGQSGRFLPEGAVILAANRKKVSTPAELADALKLKGKLNVLRVYAHGGERTLTIR
jgi:serine protease Do/serine protease DegQ